VLNIYEANAMTEGTDVTDLAVYNATTTSVDTGGNVLVSLWNGIVDNPIISGGIDWVNKYMLFDYAFFRDLNSSPDSRGEYPFNDFVILRWLLVAIGITFIFQIVLSLKGQAGLFR
jgi:hypothetical protein